MLPGVPAIGWMWVTVVGAAINVTHMTVYLVISASDSPFAQSELPAIVQWTFPVFFFGGLVAPLGLFSYRSAAEVDAGYTTNPLRHEQVDLCDWKTGRILRAAGQPLISMREFVDSRGRARGDRDG